MTLYERGLNVMARRKKSGSCLGTILGAMIMIPLFPFLFILSCAKDYRPYNSKGAKISRAKKKKLF